MVLSNLWPFALKIECKIANWVKRQKEVESEKVKLWVNLETYHPFSCPVFILDVPLQGGIGKIPRWDPQARVGVYLRHSTWHAEHIALILNITMGHVSPQYHLIFDDDFTTVESMKLGKILMNWDKLVETQCKLATTMTYKLLPKWEEQTA